MSPVLLYSASAILFVWGIAHIVPTPAIVRSFGKVSADNRKIILMEWVSEGLAMVFIGILVAAVEYRGGVDPVSPLVFKLCAGMVFVMALWTLFTGARNSILPIKICPIVKTVCATLTWIGAA